MREVKNWFQRLNNICIEADWTLSLFPGNDVPVASSYKLRLHRLIVVP
jgi:hypothetical protein